LKSKRHDDGHRLLIDLDGIQIVHANWNDSLIDGVVVHIEVSIIHS